MDEALMSYLICPVSHERLSLLENKLISESGKYEYPVEQDIAMFAKQCNSEESKAQQQHYDNIAQVYIENLGYPHTQEYTSYLDEKLLDVVGSNSLGVVAEICCGAGEAFPLIKDKIEFGIGLDISLQMLLQAKSKKLSKNFHYVQGDATQMPLKGGSVDTVIMLGGIHHVPDREALFAEISRILKPGGQFIWREPVSDFWLWRLLRLVIYRFSPMLDHQTERPLMYSETVPVLEKSGLALEQWQTYGFFGFCLFMNSDVLFFNRFFRFIPGIRKLTRASVYLDNWITHRKSLKKSGLQVIGKAIKC